MKKSVRIHFLVVTTVVAIFVFAGIWYLRPGVPNELIEQARARQLQPLLEIEAPIRRPVAEPAAVKPVVDSKALAEELLPSLTDQVSRSLEGPLYEKLKAQFVLDEDFASQISAKLEASLNLGQQSTTDEIPEFLRAEFAQQIEALRTELLSNVGEGLSSFFYQVEDMFEARTSRIEEDLYLEMEAYVPQLVDRMIPSLVVMLVEELDKNKETYLPDLAQGLKPYLIDSFTEDELLLLYTAYRDQVVADLVPSILDAMQEPVRQEVSAMVKPAKTPSAPVPPPPPTITSFVKPEVMEAPVVKASPIPTPPEVVREIKPEAPKKPVVPPAPTAATPKSEVVKPEPILAPPPFTPDEDAPEQFIDPVTYEQKRTEIRTKAIEEVLKRINSL